MARKLIETLYGKRSKYEIYRSETLLSHEFVIYRDGDYWKGTYDSLAKAVDAAKKAN